MKERGLTNMCQLQHDSFCTGLNRDITLHLFYLQERVDKHVCHVIICGYAFIVLLGSLAVFPGKTRSTRIFGYGPVHGNSVPAHNEATKCQTQPTTSNKVF